MAAVSLAVEHRRDRRQVPRLRHVREEAVEERRPRDVRLGRADAGHLPVEHRDRLEVAVDDVARTPVAPEQHAAIVGRHGRGQHLERPLEDRDRVPVARPLVVVTMRGEQARERGAAGRVDAEERGVVAFVGDPVQLDEHFDRGRLEPLPVVRRALEEPAARGRSGRAGCRTAPGPSTARTTMNGTPSHSVRLLEVHDLGHRDRRPGVHQVDGASLEREVEGGECRVRGVGCRREPGHERLVVQAEQHRVVRHAAVGRPHVGDDGVHRRGRRAPMPPDPARAAPDRVARVSCSSGQHLPGGRIERKKDLDVSCATVPVNDRVYIHEFIDIIGHHRAHYMQHMTANWGPIGQEERGQLCYGVWALIGSTGAWPKTVNMWEHEGWAGLGVLVRHGVRRPRRAGSGARAVVGQGGRVPQRRVRPHRRSRPVDAHDRGALRRWRPRGRVRARAGDRRARHGGRPARAGARRVRAARRATGGSCSARSRRRW